MALTLTHFPSAVILDMMPSMPLSTSRGSSFSRNLRMHRAPCSKGTGVFHISRLSTRQVL